MINGWCAVQPERANAKAPHPPAGGASVEFQNARVQHLALLERRADRAVQPVLQIEVAVPLHDVGEEVPVERRVLRQQRLQVELLLRRDQLVKTYRAWGDIRPLAGAFPAVVGVGSTVSDALEDHTESLPGKRLPAQPRRRSARPGGPCGGSATRWRKGENFSKRD